MQWKCLPIPKGPTGRSEIHDTNVYRAFANWADDRSLQQAFIASVAHLSDEKKLDGRIRHGDGTNTVANKGETGVVKPFLVTAMSVLASVVDRVWERLKLHYSDPQHPVSLKAYVKQLVNDLCPPKAGGVLQDELGEAYPTVQRATKEIKKNKTTIYRWIGDRTLQFATIATHTHTSGNHADRRHPVSILGLQPYMRGAKHSQNSPESDSKSRGGQASVSVRVRPLAPFCQRVTLRSSPPHKCCLRGCIGVRCFLVGRQALQGTQV
jgi:hypothetical protein